MSNIAIRQANNNDRDFVITAIIEAEKSGGDNISYCSIFGITEERLHKLLNDILDEEMEGQELCLSNFLIAEVDGKSAATLSTWIEKKDGMTSNMIKSNLFMFLLDRDIIMNAAPAIGIMSEVNIPRTENALQIECVYTDKQYRGMGLASQLIIEHIRFKQEQGDKFNMAQVILLKNNSNAQKAYERAGFHVMQEKQSANPDILKLLPGDAKILMEKTMNH
jgi:ribosomal protein S18 acetylase RimI-like enzyme